MTPAARPTRAASRAGAGHRGHELGFDLPAPARSRSARRSCSSSARSPCSAPRSSSATCPRRARAGGARRGDRRPRASALAARRRGRRRRQGSSDRALSLPGQRAAARGDDPLRARERLRAQVVRRHRRQGEGGPAPRGDRHARARSGARPGARAARSRRRPRSCSRRRTASSRRRTSQRYKQLAPVGRRVAGRSRPAPGAWRRSTRRT